jgi:hypothetical protein
MTLDRRRLWTCKPPRDPEEGPGDVTAKAWALLGASGADTPDSGKVLRFRAPLPLRTAEKYTS